jgi:hypothetical protein
MGITNFDSVTLSDDLVVAGTASITGAITLGAISGVGTLKKTVVDGENATTNITVTGIAVGDVILGVYSDGAGVDSGGQVDTSTFSVTAADTVQSSVDFDNAGTKSSLTIIWLDVA